LRKGGKSFADVYPELLVEWDYKKNTLSPTEISPKSNVRASWKCKFGHAWEASVTNRSHNMSGCPFCTNQTSKLEIFILCELRAVFDSVEWRKKFDGVECDIFIPAVSIGIEVDGEYWHRLKMDADIRKNRFLESCGVTVIRVRDSRIPVLPGRQIQFSPSQQPIEIHLALLREIQGLQPIAAVKKYLDDGVQRREKDYRAMIARLPAPPAGRTLADLFPAIAKEWDYEENLPLTPDLFAPGSEQKVAWRCLLGHKWNATIKNRAKLSSGCPDCYRGQQSEQTTKRLAKKAGTLEAASPPFLSLWDHSKNSKFRPGELAASSSHRVWWMCPKGHSFSRSPAHMSENSECPRCNSLLCQRPEIAAQWDTERNGDRRPEEYLPGSAANVWWRCEYEHTWRSAINQRTAGSGCPQCFEVRRSFMPEVALARREGKSLAELNPPCLIEWDQQKNGDEKPSDVLLNNKQKYWWQCLHGHTYQQTVVTKVRGYNCPECAKVTRAEAVRRAKLLKSGSLADKFAALAAEWHPSRNGTLQPSDVSCNSHMEVWWLCPKGHEWKKSPGYRVTLAKRGSQFICPICTPTRAER
jgi:hypothetical protein